MNTSWDMRMTGKMGRASSTSGNVRTWCLSALVLLSTTVSTLALQSGDYTYTLSGGKATITDFNSAYTGALAITNMLGDCPVTSIGGYAFFGCSGLTGVTIPVGVTSIGNYAFYGCSGLIGVTIPVGVTSIGNQAFNGCSGLAGVLTIPSGVISIEGYAFYGCSGLTGVTIPSSVTNIGSAGFAYCSSLTAITVDSANPSYSSMAGVLFNKSKTTLVLFPAVKAGSYVIPASVTQLESYAFRGCSGLTGMTFPDGLTGFSGWMFEGCSHLATFTVNASNPNYSVVNGVLFNKSRTWLMIYPTGRAGSYVIPSGVIVIWGSAFWDCRGLTGVTIPVGVTHIEESAFFGCIGLTGVTIPGSVIGIHNNAFYGCSGLTDVTIPVGVTNIGAWAFYGCSGLTGVTIPGSVTNIGSAGFAYCSSLTAITVDSANPSYSSMAGVLFNKNQTTLILFPAGKAGNYEVPAGVTGIEYVAFAGCSGLTSVMIPASVTSIGNFAFEDCLHLTGVYFKGNVPISDYGLFYGAYQVIIYHLAGAMGWPGVPSEWNERPTALWSLPLPPAPPPAPAPYVSSPLGDVAFATLGSFDGYFYGTGAFGDGAATAVRGTLTLKITGLAGKLTAKAVLQKAALNFSATAWSTTEADGTCRVTLTAKGGGSLDLHVRQNRVWGTLASGTLGNETLTLDGARNRFAEKADAAAQALLAGLKGYYTAALPVSAALSLGSAEAAPQGSGYLAVTIGGGGSAKIAGVLADGTKVSQASRLILFNSEGPEACVPFFLPLYGKTGWVGGLLWIDPSGRALVTDRDLGWYVRWEKPGVGADGFGVLLDVDGGYYGSGAALASAYLFTADAGGVPFYTGTGFADAAAAALPEGVAVAGGKLTMVKGMKPTLTEGAYDYSGVNSSLATLTFTSGTGLFKGKFNLYYDYTQGGKLTHKAVNVPYAGVLTPVRSDVFAAEPAGQGHCLVPDNDPAVKAYKIKRSLPVRLEADE